MFECLKVHPLDDGKLRLESMPCRTYGDCRDRKAPERLVIVSLFLSSMVQLSSIFISVGGSTSKGR